MSYKIFLIGLNVKYTEQEIYNFFLAKYGEKITKVTLKSSKAKNTKNGCGVLEVSSKKCYEQILSHRKFSYKDRHFFANIFLKGNQLNKFKEEILKRRVYISCLRPSFTDEEIKSIFSQIGDIEDAFLIRRPNGVVSNYGYVMFSSVKDATKALKIGIITVAENKIVISPFKNKHFKGVSQHKQKLNASLEKGGIKPLKNNQRRDNQRHINTRRMPIGAEDRGFNIVPGRFKKSSFTFFQHSMNNENLRFNSSSSSSNSSSNFLVHQTSVRPQHNHYEPPRHTLRAGRLTFNRPYMVRHQGPFQYLFENIPRVSWTPNQKVLEVSQKITLINHHTVSNLRFNLPSSLQNSGKTPTQVPYYTNPLRKSQIYGPSLDPQKGKG